MKKFILLFVSIVLALGVSAQSTSPRFGTLKNQDNTARVLTYKVATATDATGADSLVLNTTAYQTIYKIACKDSVVLKQPTIASAYYGDRLTIILTSTTGTPKVLFNGTYWKASGTATLSTGLRGVIELVFDGAYWVESNRSIH